MKREELPAEQIGFVFGLLYALEFSVFEIRRKEDGRGKGLKRWPHVTPSLSAFFFSIFLHKHHSTSLPGPCQVIPAEILWAICFPRRKCYWSSLSSCPRGSRAASRGVKLGQGCDVDASWSNGSWQTGFCSLLHLCPKTLNIWILISA